MSRPRGLLRAGYPYLKSLGMRRVTNFPIDIAFGADEKLYVLLRESGNAFIRVWSFNDSEQFTDDLVQIGSYGANEGQFQWPVQLITDVKGDIYVSDEANHTISIFNSEGNFLSRWGKQGSPKGRFNGPAGIAFDPEGNIVVVDSINHRIQKYTHDGKFIFQFGKLGDKEGQFSRPWGVHVDELGKIYVADWGNHRVQVFTNEGNFTMLLDETSTYSSKMKNPSGVAVDSHGDIYVADWGNNRVLMFDSNGRYVWKFLGDATLSMVARSYMMTNAYSNRLREMANIEEDKYLRRPTSIRIDSKFRLCIADHMSYRLQVYQKDAIELDEHTIFSPMRNPSLTTA